jgi:hypothetical protein
MGRVKQHKQEGNMATGIDYESALAELDQRESEQADRRKARDESEFREHVLPVLNKHGLTRENLIRCPDAPAELPGHIVIRAPKRAEFSKLNHSMWKDGDGSAEEKAAAPLEVARACVLYPPRDRYDALVEAYPAVAPQVATRALALAKAGAMAMGKK